MYRLVTLQPGKTYNFSVWLFMVQAPGSTQLSLREPDDTAALGTSQAFVVQSANDPALHKWTQRSWKFTLPIICTQTDYAVAYSNLSPAASGNDLFFDDVELAETTDTTGAATASCATAPAVLPKVTTLPDAASTATGAAVTINVTGNDASSDPVNAALGAPRRHLVHRSQPRQRHHCLYGRPGGVHPKPGLRKPGTTSPTRYVPLPRQYTPRLFARLKPWP